MEELVYCLTICIHINLFNYNLYIGIGLSDDRKRKPSFSSEIPLSVHSIATSLHVNRGERERELMHVLGAEGQDAPVEALNARALTVIQRVQDKLTGRDFVNEELNVMQQVDRVIKQATSNERLCQCYIG